MNDIAYEKGALFLRTIEEAVGREKFDRFLRTYFESHAFQSMDTRGFLAYLKKNLVTDPALAQRLQIDAWVFGPAVPSNAPQIRSDAFNPVDQAIASFQGVTPAAQLTTQGWTTQHWLHFLRNLPKPLDVQKMADLDSAFNFSNSGNSEILSEWLLRSIENRYEAAYPSLERFLTSMGRRKFLRPLYSELAKTPEGTELALRIYEKARPSYHPVSQASIDQILDWRG